MNRIPVIVQVAAAEVAPTGVPISDAVRSAVLYGAACIGEMNETGFDTNNAFSHDWLNGRAGTPEGVFTLNSVGLTSAVYMVVLRERVGDVYRAAVKVYDLNELRSGRINYDRFYSMTLVCADNGTIRMNAGW